MEQPGLDEFCCLAVPAWNNGAPAALFGGTALELRRLTARAQCARLCAMRPGGVAEPAVPLSWAANHPTVRGALLCRAGRYDEAVQALSDRPDVTAVLYRALAEHGRGRDDAARTALQDAERRIGASSEDNAQQNSRARKAWDERLELDLLHEEVTRVLTPGVR
jgi:hypothetical protein